MKKTFWEKYRKLIFFILISLVVVIFLINVFLNLKRYDFFLNSKTEDSELNASMESSELDNPYNRTKVEEMIRLFDIKEKFDKAMEKYRGESFNYPEVPDTSKWDSYQPPTIPEYPEIVPPKMPELPQIDDRTLRRMQDEQAFADRIKALQRMQEEWTRRRNANADLERRIKEYGS